MSSYLLSSLILVRRISVCCMWKVVNVLFRFSSRISSLSTIFLFLHPGFPFGPYLVQFSPPLTLDLLAQKVLASKYYWHRIACHISSSRNWYHRWNRKLLTSWQIALSVPVEPDQRRHSWYLRTFRLAFLSYISSCSIWIGGSRISMLPLPMRFSIFLA